MGYCYLVLTCDYLVWWFSVVLIGVLLLWFGLLLVDLVNSVVLLSYLGC